MAERINLISNFEKIQIGLTQEVLDQQFLLDFPPDTAKSFTEAKTEDERQNLLNSIFTKERQEKMLALASKDKDGRSVKYYRYLSTPHFLSLLEKGDQTSYDLLENEDQQFDENDLRIFLTNYYLESFVDEEKRETVRSQLAGYTLQDFFLEVFPSAPRNQIEIICKTRRLMDIRKFLDANMSNAAKQNLHNSYYSMQLTSYLALSVGGPIRKLNDSWPTVYLEVVLPDSDVIIKPRGFKSEKEIVVKKIKSSNISRVYLEGQLQRDVIENPGSPIGQYELTHKPGVWDAMSKWRIGEDVANVLPVSLVSKYLHLDKRFAPKVDE